MNSKVCLTTYVYGANYQNYIPLFVYSAKKSYPEYYIIIFIHGKLKDKVKKQLDLIKQQYEFDVIENQFDDLNIINGFEARTLRWVLPSKYFAKFDYLYIVDIDIFYIKEPLALHCQHIEHMEYLDLPFSNAIRYYCTKALSMKAIYLRIRDSGMHNFLKYIFTGTLSSKKLTGLHFIKIDPYIDIVKQNQENLIQLIKSKSYRERVLINDEVLLYEMIEKSGFDMSRLGTIKNDAEMLDFINPKRAVFRPHHGIHLGIFKARKFALHKNPILESDVYKYYINIFRDNFEDQLFCNLLAMGSKSLKTKIYRLCSYYQLKDAKNILYSIGIDK